MDLLVNASYVGIDFLVSLHGTIMPVVMTDGEKALSVRSKSRRAANPIPDSVTIRWPALWWGPVYRSGSPQPGSA